MSLIGKLLSGHHNNIQYGTGINLYEHPEAANPKYYQSDMMKQLMAQKAAQMQQTQRQGIQQPQGSQIQQAINPPPPQQPIKGPTPAISQPPPVVQPNLIAPPQIPSRSSIIPNRGNELSSTIDNNPLNSAVLGGIPDSVRRNPKTIEYLQQYNIKEFKNKPSTSSANDASGYSAMASDAASQAGISATYLPKVLGVESGGNPKAVSPSGAKGLYQFTGKTWNYINNKYDLNLTDKFDPAQNTKAAAYLAKDNAEGLTNAGIPVTDTNLYITHNIGLGGTKKLLNANPNAKVNQVLDPVLINNNPLFFKNKDGSWKTVGESLNAYTNKIGD